MAIASLRRSRTTAGLQRICAVLAMVSEGIRDPLLLYRRETHDHRRIPDSTVLFSLFKKIGEVLARENRRIRTGSWWREWLGQSPYAIPATKKRS